MISVFVSLCLEQHGPNHQGYGPLEECVAMPATTTSRWPKAELNVESAEVDFFQTKAAFAPTISGSLFAGYSFGRLDQYNLVFVNQRTTGANIGVNGNMLLLRACRTSTALNRPSMRREANQLAVQQSENDLSLNLTNAYLQLLFAMDRLSITEGQILLTKPNTNAPKPCTRRVPPPEAKC